MMLYLFISGTDTQVGKTAVSCAVMTALEKAGLTVVPRKPVETGCVLGAEGMRAGSDAARLLEACALQHTIDDVSPYRFESFCSGARAMAIENRAVSLEKLLTACRTSAHADVLLVEGAGGLYSPLAEGLLNVHLAVALGGLVWLVAPNVLGVVGHVLSCVYAAKHFGCKIAGVILNNNTDDEPFAQKNVWRNAEAIEEVVGQDMPVVELPFCVHDDALKNALAGSCLLKNLVSRVKET